jgi:ATP-dependent DNA helicase DinG
VITIEQIFGPEGAIAAQLDRYEQRSGQIALAQAVEDIIDGGGVLLGEAGTGTGKTLAYLVPALLSGQRVVVSTGTRNLQEQIFFRDLAFLCRALNRDVRAVCLKGQENYLCRNRLHRFMTSPACLSWPAADVERLSSFAGKTRTGDRMELTDLEDDAAIWREVASTRETRIGQRCPFFDECFVTRVRREAMQADLIVVNHHLYFADIATRRRGGTILPAHDVVIFDEAHLIEDIATEFFSITISSSRIQRALNDSLAAVQAARLIHDPFETERRRTIKRLQGLLADFFDRFQNPVQGRTSLEHGTLTSTNTAWHRLDATLESVEMSMRAIEGQDEAVDHCTCRILEIRQDLGAVLDETDSGYVYWVETRKRSVQLGASPIDISDSFRKEVLLHRLSVILCSATLSTGRDFRFLKSRLGIDMETTEIVVDAPFDYPRQARLYLPPALPDPRHGDWLPAAILEIQRLIELTDGGAMVLCTSNRSMHAIYDTLLCSAERPVLRQGLAPKTTLIQQFMDNPDSVLVATSSFWQGVDIPGDALRLVLIDKLPFAAPTDPVTAARIDRLIESNRNAFVDYQVPSAVLTLKQGFGRLIRTARDRGIVAILDSRIQTRRYGKRFLSSLPPATPVTEFEDLAAWWNFG